MTLAVGLLHFTAPPVVGGVETVLGRQARHLASAGHRVRVVVGRGGSPGGGMELVRVPLVDTRNATIRAAQGALDRGVVPPGFETLVQGLADELARALEDLDVVVAHNACSLNVNVALTAALARVAKAGAVGAGPALVAWDHDVAAALDQYRARLHAGYPWDLFRRPWPGVTMVTISEARRAELAAAIGVRPDSIRVVPNGIDRDEHLALSPSTRALLDSLALRTAGPVLLLPARIMPRKNIELGIAVCAHLRRSGFDARLVVTGMPDTHDPRARGYMSELQGLASASGAAPGIHFLADGLRAWRSGRVVADLYRVSDALFLPSFDEGFGLPLLEAAASRLPVICADVPALRELAGPDATYVDPRGDPAEAAAAVTGRLDGDPAHRFAVRARTEYDWSALLTTQLEPLLLQAAARRPSMRR